MNERKKIVFVGLSLSSSWGNGHATTYRALIRGLAGLGHEVDFYERDVPWYADHRDLAEPEFCGLHLYRDQAELFSLLDRHDDADAVIIGSFVPEGAQIIDRIRAKVSVPLAFYDIDTPVTLARIDSGEALYLEGRQIPIFDLYFSFSGGKVLTRLEKQYGAQRARALYCSVDPDLYSAVSEPLRWDLGYLGTFSPDRQPTLEKLLLEPARRLPHRRFVVAGPQYPPDIDWPENVERIEHLPPSAHAPFYSSQSFTLNVTRADMIAAGHSPSVRLFEAAACGTPVISDRWAGLEELLPGGILIADETVEVEQILERISGDSRESIADRARAIVLERHTGAARARELLAALEQIQDKPRVRSARIA